MKHASKIGFSAILATVAATSAFAADVKVGGFVNGQYTMNFSNQAISGIRVPEAAISLTKEGDGSNAMFILPFTQTIGGANSIAYSTSLTQAFVGHKYTNGFNWKIGKFEKIFGNEGIYTSMLPLTTLSGLTNVYGLTHTGILLGYETSGMSVKFLAANNSITSNDNGGLWGSDGPDLGLRVDFADLFYVGGRYRFQASGVNTDYMVNAGLKFNAKPMELGLDFALRNTAANVSAWGISGMGVYGATDMIDLAARVEYLNSTTTANVNTFVLNVGPQFKMSKEMRVRLNYNLDAPSPGTTGHSVDLSGVYVM